MKICIYGAGAAGCSVGARLFESGVDVSLVGRGVHLETIRKKGLRMIGKDGDKILKIRCTDNPAELGHQDYVIISTKSFSIPEVAPKIPALLGKNTAVIPACNGLPWWFFNNFGGRMENYKINCLDPKHVIEKYIPYERVIGGLFYMAATFEKDGVISNFEGPKFLVGEPEGKKTPRLEKLVAVLEKAGFKRPLAENIRTEIWKKLCWNTPFNPLSVIYEMNSGEMAANKEVTETARNVMKELLALAQIIKLPVELDIEKHIGLAEKAGTHKPSMLQDYERGRRMEIESIIASICEIADTLCINLPTVKSVYNKLKRKDSIRD